MGKSDKQPRQRSANHPNASARPVILGRTAHSLSTRMTPQSASGAATSTASISASQVDADKVSKERHERKAQLAAAREWDASQDKKEKDAINGCVEVSKPLDFLHRQSTDIHA